VDADEEEEETGDDVGESNEGFPGVLQFPITVAGFTRNLTNGSGKAMRVRKVKFKF